MSIRLALNLDAQAGFGPKIMVTTARPVHAGLAKATRSVQAPGFARQLFAGRKLWAPRRVAHA